VILKQNLDNNCISDQVDLFGVL